MSKKYLDDTGLSHLWDKIKSKISSMIADEAGKMKPYGYCTTASKTVAKVVTVSPAITELTTGLTIAVKFEYANGVANPTLNVNGTGAKAIKRYGTTAPSTSAASSWNANSVITLTYDGTYWQIGDWNNTTYSTMSDAEYQAGTSTSARLITPARLKGAIEHWADKNVNADWDATSGDAQILNKPTIPSKTSDLTNDSNYVTADTLVSYPSVIDLYESYTPTLCILVVNGSTATLNNGSSPQTMSLFMMAYNSVAGVLIAQVLNNSSSLQTAKARIYQVAEVDATTAKVRLVSVDDGVLYTADLQDTGDGLTGTFSSQTIGEGGGGSALEPLIGSTSKITPAQVKTALQEGRDICIQKAGIFEGINLDLRFTSWNSATDTDYSGQAMDVVVSQTIARYGTDSDGEYYLFELVGIISNGQWTLFNTILAQATDIPTKTSDLTNDSGYITESDVEDEIFIATYDSTSYSDILSAYNDGKIIFCKNGSTYVPLTRSATDTFYFRFLDSLNEAKQYYVNSSGWSSGGSFSFVTTNRTINGKGLSTDITLTASDVGALPNTTAIPTKTSDLTNDSGFIAEETDPTVPAWAKASTKPSYTASEVGALASTGGQVTGDITLYVASGNSPSIIFQRGTLTDNYNDWKIYDKSGFLYFAQRGNGSSAFGDVGYIDTGGVLRNFTIPWGSVSGKPTFATVATSGSYNDLSDKPTIPEGLPSVTTADNGKVLRVVNGEWTAVSLPSASGVSF